MTNLKKLTKEEFFEKEKKFDEIFAALRSPQEVGFLEVPPSEADYNMYCAHFDAAADGNEDFTGMFSKSGMYSHLYRG